MTGESGILEAALDKSTVKQGENGVLVMETIPHSVSPMQDMSSIEAF